MLSLRVPAQNYAWGRPAALSEVGGRVGRSVNRTRGPAAALTRSSRRVGSLHACVCRVPPPPQVAKLAGLNGSDIDESKPFAELW
jgi:hypothetical protein